MFVAIRLRRAIPNKLRFLYTILIYETVFGVTHCIFTKVPANLQNAYDNKQYTKSRRIWETEKKTHPRTHLLHLSVNIVTVPSRTSFSFLFTFIWLYVCHFFIYECYVLKLHSVYLCAMSKFHKIYPIQSVLFFIGYFQQLPLLYFVTMAHNI